ncbi:hypothetical protein C8R43DRAFT_949674 [Mycena crocata]|nr:hypothetical protein C8R43DRAFT_949674 [Mycena crocata]
MSCPTDEEVLTAVRSLWTVDKPPGVKRLVASLKESHPDWALRINGKMVRAAVQKCEEETGVTNKKEEDVPVTPKKIQTTPKQGQATLTTREAQAALLAQADWLRTYTATHPWPRSVPRETGLSSGKLLSKHTLEFIVLPALAMKPPQRADETMRDLLLSFHLFYLEWDCFLGPDPADALPSATPLVPDFEAMHFFMLFPYGTGHYLGAKKQGGLTFDEYALHRLNMADARFRDSADWLTWALTRTSDPGLAKAINCMLVHLHKQKARHLGGGRVQVLRLGEEFKKI